MDRFVLREEMYSEAIVDVDRSAANSPSAEVLTFSKSFWQSVGLSRVRCGHTRFGSLPSQYSLLPSVLEQSGADPYSIREIMLSIGTYIENTDHSIRIDWDLHNDTVVILGDDDTVVSRWP